VIICGVFFVVTFASYSNDFWRIMTFGNITNQWRNFASESGVVGIDSLKSMTT